MFSELQIHGFIYMNGYNTWIYCYKKGFKIIKTFILAICV